MVVTEVSLDTEDLETHIVYIQAGLARLEHDAEAQPSEIIRALRVYLDAERGNVAALAAVDEDAYADAVLELAHVFGEQICRAYAWEWTRLQFDGQDGGVNVVAPQRNAYVNPIRLLKDIVDVPHRSNNTALLFNMVAPEVLELQTSEDDRRSGRYLGLH